MSHSSLRRMNIVGMAQPQIQSKTTSTKPEAYRLHPSWGRNGPYLPKCEWSHSPMVTVLTGRRQKVDMWTLDQHHGTEAPWISHVMIAEHTDMTHLRAHDASPQLRCTKPCPFMDIASIRDSQSNISTQDKTTACHILCATHRHTCMGSLEDIPKSVMTTPRPPVYFCTLFDHKLQQLTSTDNTPHTRITQHTRPPTRNNPIHAYCTPLRFSHCRKQWSGPKQSRGTSQDHFHIPYGPYGTTENNAYAHGPVM